MKQEERLKDSTGNQLNNLSSAAKFVMLTTPVRSDARTGSIIGKNDTFRETKGLPRKVNQNGTGGSVGLARLVQLLPTPKAQEARGNASKDRGKRNLTDEVSKLHNIPGKSSQLNPRFVAEMMGFPVNWTELPFQSGGTNQ